MLTISETVDTSKDSKVTVEDNHLKFDFPHDYSVKLGSLWTRSIFCYVDEDHLTFCANRLNDKINQHVLESIPYIPGGNPKTRPTYLEEANQYYKIKSSLVSWLNDGDNIVFEYVPETEPDTERMVLCRKK